MAALTSSTRTWSARRRHSPSRVPVPRRQVADAGDAEGTGEADLIESEEDMAGVETDGADPEDEDGGVQDRDATARPAERKDAIERMHRGLGPKARSIRESRTHAREDQPISRSPRPNSPAMKTPNRKFDDPVSTRWAMRTAY